MAMGYNAGMHHIFVTGSLAYDRIMNFPGLFKDHFIPDKLHNINVAFTVDTPKREFGGTAGNIAYNLMLLEEKPHILSTAGNDFDAYKTWFAQNNIDSSTIEVYEDTSTATAYIVTDQGDNQITAYSEGADSKPYGKAITGSPEALAIVAPTAPGKMRMFASRFRELSVPYLFDPGQRIPMLSGDELKEMIDGSEAVFVNDYELQLVKTRTGWSEDDMVSKTSILIVTLGAQGSRILTKEGETTVPAAKVREAPDPTGAGDAYRAGFMKGRVLGLTTKQCVQLGSVVAAYAVEHHGTQTYRFTLPEVRTRYMESYNEDLVVS